MIRYDFIFEIEENVDDEIDERVNNAFFTIFDARFDVEIERRENFVATTERETISIQNNDFFDVATDAVNDCFEMINDVTKSENFVIDSEDLIDDVNIKIDSFDEDVAENVDIANIVFDADSTISHRDEVENENIVFDENVTIFLTDLFCCCNIALY